MFKRRGQGNVSIIADHKRRRRNEHARSLAVRAVLGALVLVGVVATVLFLPQLSIRTVTITGTQILPTGDIKSIAESALAGRVWGIIPRAQFFLVSTDAVRDTIAQAFPRAKAVYVARRFPHTLAVTIEEHDVWGVLCKREACLYVSRDGVVLDAASSTEGETLVHIADTRESVITAGLPAFDEKTARLLTVFAEGVPHALGISAQAFVLGSEYDSYIDVTTQEGWHIIADADTDPARALENLKLVLSKEIPARDRLEYIDLRLPNKVFYKFRS